MPPPPNGVRSRSARRVQDKSDSNIPASLTEKEIRQQLERILDCDLFSRAERLSRFLRYVVKQALDGNAGELKEYPIALDVFDRSESFDNRVDPIVRVEAGRLRAKIREYYATVGKNDPVWVGLRRRGYRPLFKERNTPERRRAVSEQSSALGSLPTTPEKTEEIPGRNSNEVAIAVLPFADLSPEQTQQYFCEALADQIINAVAKVRKLRVTGRTSALQFKDKAEDVRVVGRQLKVDSVLEGSVQRVGKHIRVNVQLLSAANGLDLWGDTYDRPLDDVFAIQDEITQAVVAGLKGTLLPDAEPSPRLKNKKKRNPGVEAYNEYLKGLYHWNKRSGAELKTSIERFEACIEKDPRYGPAYAGLSACYVILGISSAVAPREVMSKAREAALKALELDPQLTKAQACLGLVKSLYEWDWEAARENFERAVQLNPRNSTAHHWYAIGYLCPQGNLESALERMQRAQQLNPASVIVNTHLGLVHYMKREYQRAARQFRLAIEMEPSFYRAYWDLGRTYVQDCNLDQAVEAFEKARDLTDGMFRLGALGHCYGFLGDEKRARQVLDQLLQSKGKRYVSAYDVAEVFLGLKDYDQMFEWLDKAYEQHSPWLSWISVDPVFDDLRTEPRFIRILKTIGLQTAQAVPAA